MAVVNELVSRFSFVGSLTPQRDFNVGLAQSVTLLGAVATGIAASAGGLFAFVASSTEAADALTDLNAETGISVERFQELGFAAELSGSSSDAMTSSLTGLSKVAGDAARGLGRGKKAFDELGISVKDAGGNVKTADVLFGELGDKFKALGTDTATQKSIMASLGLDPSTLQLLNATGEEVDALIQKSRALGIVTTEQAEAAAEFQDALGIAGFAVSAIRQQIAIGLAPAMTDITNKFTGFLEANHEVIEEGLKYLGQIIISTMGFIQRMAPLVLGLAAAFGVASLATGGFATIMSFALSPVVLITAAIVAVLLILDDLITAFNGGQSVIADFFQEFFGVDIVPIMHEMVDAFMWMVDTVIAVLQPLFDAWGHMFDAVIKLFKGDFTGALDSVSEAFASWIEAVKGIFGLLFDYLAAGWGKILGGIKEGAMSILPEWAVNMIGSGETPDAAQLGPNEAMAMGGNSSSSVNSSIEQQVQINVSSNDPKAAGAAVNDALQDQLKTAKTQVNRGGR